MSLMGTLAKMAVGYAAARGMDKLATGGGLQNLLGGGARVPATDPMAQSQAQMADQMTGNPMGAMMEKMKEGGLDLGALMGGGAGGANPMANMMEQMQSGGLGGLMGSLMGGGAGAQGDAAQGGDQGGLLSSIPGGGAGLVGIMAALGGAAAMTGKGAGQAIDQLKTAETMPQAEETASLMLRAMIQAAKADGEIDDAERAKIIETIGDDADPADIAFVQDQLGAPIDVAGLAQATPDALKPQVYAASLMTIRLDTQAEAQYLDALAQAMGLTQPVVNTLHMQMGMQPLYG